MSDLRVEIEKEPVQGDTNRSRVKNRVGLVATCALGGSLVALYAVAVPFIAPALRKTCLPFVPATNTQVKNVLRALQSRSGTLVDIGSGDGRIVIAAAREGFRSVGFELNPWLVWYSRYRAWKQGVHRHTSFYISDLWKMEQLEAKLQTELQSSARVVACRFPFPTWTPDHVTGEGIDTVWVYDAETFKSHTTTAKAAEPQ
ncbi:ATP synthase subunit C lysine N-methyltransferase isoform X1 [Ictalurus punctatus]|uniref:ATP synthase subunit C lysine N-methyltransferase isoform X1 n=1 Tax=Ictalurus punctatus TaxID=7998 RepID=A0A2D0R794_ICTPU|nr:ATP synthase subunit C lysine N-methyltransferase isoform X1 [Ictalurus punctatus]